MTTSYEADPGDGHDVYVEDLTGNKTLMNVVSRDRHGSDLTVKESKERLLQDMGIACPEDYFLVLTRSDLESIPMPVNKKMIDFVCDLASDAYLSVEIVGPVTSHL